MKNKMQISFLSRSSNEAFARIAVSGFLAQLDPTVDELAEIKTVISEAVTNSIVHGYKSLPEGQVGNIYISVRLYENREVTVEISDNGCGIEDVARARQPMFTTGEYGDRCGMGFLVMESFTDFLSVKSRPGKGTRVLMRKKLNP